MSEFELSSVSGRAAYQQRAWWATDLQSPTLSVCEAVPEVGPLLSVDVGARSDLDPEAVADLRLTLPPEPCAESSAEM